MNHNTPKRTNNTQGINDPEVINLTDLPPQLDGPENPDFEAPHPDNTAPVLPFSQMAIVCFAIAVLSPIYYSKWTHDETPLTIAKLITLLISALSTITLGHLTMRYFTRCPNTHRGEVLAILGVFAGYILLFVLVTIELL